MILNFIKQVSISDAPNSINGVVLSKLGKKNWVKLYNIELDTLSTVPAKDCRNCGEPMNWMTKGQIQKRIKGNYTYQNNCHDGCHKLIVDDVVCIPQLTYSITHAIFFI